MEFLPVRIMLGQNFHSTSPHPVVKMHLAIGNIRFVDAGMEMDKVDVIIVTVMQDFLSIKQNIQLSSNSKVISIEQILDNIVDRY